MNVIIPYRHEVADGLELKHALRSIETYLTGYGEIYIVGDEFPTWLTNVTWVKYNEPKRKSSLNILNKILEAFKQSPGNLLQWQDDIYLQKPLEVSQIKYWYKGTMAEAVKRSTGNYKQLCIETGLKTADSFPYYDIHAPIIYNETLLRQMRDRMDWTNTEYLLKTSYCWVNKFEGEPLDDCKIGLPTKLHEPRERISGKLFWSTGPQGLEPHTIDLLKELYPEKSKYES